MIYHGISVFGVSSRGTFVFLVVISRNRHESDLFQERGNVHRPRPFAFEIGITAVPHRNHIACIQREIDVRAAHCVRQRGVIEPPARRSRFVRADMHVGSQQKADGARNCRGSEFSDVRVKGHLFRTDFVVIGRGGFQTAYYALVVVKRGLFLVARFGGLFKDLSFPFIFFRGGHIGRFGNPNVALRHVVGGEPADPPRRGGIAVDRNDNLSHPAFARDHAAGISENEVRRMIFAAVRLEHGRNRKGIIIADRAADRNAAVFIYGNVIFFLIEQIEQIFFLGARYRNDEVKPSVAQFVVINDVVVHNYNVRLGTVVRIAAASRKKGKTKQQRQHTRHDLFHLFPPPLFSYNFDERLINASSSVIVPDSVSKVISTLRVSAGAVKVNFIWKNCPSA